jgi:hypothetical protein
MALREREDSMTYVGVYDGKLEVRVTKDTPNAIEREKTKKGKPTGEFIHVKTYGSLEGKIKDIRKDMKELPDGTKFSSLKILVDDIGDKYVLNWPYNSDLTRAFYHMVEVIDLDTTVEFSVGKSKNKKGKEVTSLFIKQNGANLKWKYTREYPYAPGETVKPEWVEKEIKGEKVWDNTDEIRFFENILKEKVLPKLRTKAENVPVSQAPDDDDWIPSMPPPEPEEEIVSPEEDMPF